MPAAEVKPDGNIKIGSVVKLKSGGPAMVVQNIFQDAGAQTVARCTWFDKDLKPLSDKFVISALAYESDN